MKNKTKMYVIIGICMALVGMFVLLNSYAIWRVKKEQTGTNVVVGACLNFTLEEEKDENNNPIDGFSLKDTWPISDEEGQSLKGYTFKLENTCNKPIDYEIVLESLTTTNENYFDNEYVKVQLDNKEIKRYSDLEEIDSEEENNIRETRHLYSGTIQKHVEDSEYNKKTHTLKVWISEDSPNSEIGKEFKSRIRVYAGQLQIPPEHPLSDESCFGFDSYLKRITYYNKNRCGTELVLPATINGIPIEKIEFNSSTYSILTDVRLENAIYLKRLPEHAFLSYVGTGKDLIIPDSVTTIGNEAFPHFNGLHIIFGKNLTTIGNAAFRYYEGTGQELIIPDNVIEISASAFMNYKGFELKLGESVNIIGDTSFGAYEGLNQDLVIPDSVSYISGNAFQNFNGIKLILGNSVTTIGNAAFYHYVGSGQILLIPASVTNIYGSAFYSFVGDVQTYSQTLCDSVGSWAPYAASCIVISD